MAMPQKYSLVLIRAAPYYEENCPANLDGVGGFANITDLDLEGSKRFIRELEA
jgi:hypothetical protein